MSHMKRLKMNSNFKVTVYFWIEQLDSGGPVVLNRQQADNLVFLLKYMKNELETYIEIFAEECKLS